MIRCYNLCIMIQYDIGYTDMLIIIWHDKQGVQVFSKLGKYDSFSSAYAYVSLVLINNMEKRINSENKSDFSYMNFYDIYKDISIIRKMA